jgi:hypothetical protein
MEPEPLERATQATLMRMAVVIVGVLFVLFVLVVGVLVVVFVIAVIVRVPMLGAVFVLMRMRMRTFVLHGFEIQLSLRLLIPTLEHPSWRRVCRRL